MGQQKNNRAKKSSACRIRECDETEKGNFVAYVDEGTNSYDVNITLDDERKLVSSSCDCGFEKQCVHVTALLHHVTIVKDQQSTLPAPKAKGLRAVIANTDPERLKSWLAELISTHEDVKLLFAAAFNPAATYDPDKVREQIQAATRSVLGKEPFPNRKLILKLAGSLASIHEPVLRFYLGAPFENSRFEALRTIVEFLDHKPVPCPDQAIFLDTYTDRLTAIVEPISRLADENLFRQTIGYFIKDLEPGKYSGACLVRVLALIMKTASAERARFVVDELTFVFLHSTGLDTQAAAQSSKAFQSALVFLNLFEEFGHILPADVTDRNTNDQVVENLIQSRRFDLAFERCWYMLRKTMMKDEKLRLLQILKSLSIQMEDIPRLTAVLSILVPLNFEYRDFVLLQQHLPEVEAAELRSTMISSACLVLYKEPQKFRFAYQLFQDEKNTEKMLRFLHRTVSYVVIESSVESLIAYDKDAFIQQMFRIPDKLDHDSDYAITGPEFDAVDRIVTITLEHYNADDLRAAIEKLYRSRQPFVTMNFFTAILADALQDMSLP